MDTRVRLSKKEKMQVQEILDSQLLKEQEERKKAPSGKINPGRLGKCLRAQWYYYTQAPESNPPDKLALRKFKRGNVFHKLVQDAILLEEPLAEAEFEVTTADIHGFVDILLPDETVEIKSVSHFGFQHLTKGDKTIGEQRPDWILQATCYAYNLDKDFMRIVIVNCESMQIEEFYMKVTGELAEKMCLEVATINEMRMKNWEPDRQPRLYNGKECSYCNWKGLCDGDNN